MNFVEKRGQIEKEYSEKREMWSQMGKARESLEREMLMLRGKVNLLDEIEADEKRVYDEATKKLETPVEETLPVA